MLARLMQILVTTVLVGGASLVGASQDGGGSATAGAGGGRFADDAVTATTRADAVVPEVTLEGPGQAEPGATVVVVATLVAGVPETVRWEVDGREVAVEAVEAGAAPPERATEAGAEADVTEGETAVAGQWRLEWTFTEAGAHDVSVHVVGAAGETRAHHRVDVVEAAPEARFAILTPEGERVAGRAISFEDRSVDAERISWDFGDGTRSEEPAPRHAYAAPGEYTVTLTARRGDQEATATGTVRIIADDREAPAPGGDGPSGSSEEGSGRPPGGPTPTRPSSPAPTPAPSSSSEPPSSAPPSSAPARVSLRIEASTEGIATELDLFVEAPEGARGRIAGPGFTVAVDGPGRYEARVVVPPGTHAVTLWLEGYVGATAEFEVVPTPPAGSGQAGAA